MQKKTYVNVPHRTSSTKRRGAFVFVIALFILIFGMIRAFGTPPRATSVEMAFTDSSASNLSIVPASGGSTPSGCGPGTLNDQCPCSLPWGGSIPHGAATGAYQSSSVPYGSSCIGETRWCNNGALSGSFTSPSCAVQPRPSPSCSVSVVPSTINQGSLATVSWSSSNADTFYIANISYVTPNQNGATSVSPSQTTSYSGTASGNGTANCGTTLTVYQSCTFNGSSIANGGSVTAYQAPTVSYGSSCASETRTCSNGTLSGSYAYSSCSVTPPANCTQDGVTINHGSSYTFYSQQTAAGGTLCSAYSQSRTCYNGTLSGSASYQYASCSCAPAYSCAGSNVTYTDASCTTSTVVSCTAPGYCTPGVSSCQYPPIIFNPNGPFTGHLQARPAIVRIGSPTHLYWNVSNAQSCTVTGGGQTWTGLSSGSSGVATNPVSQRTTYSLACTGFSGQSNINESVDVLVNPSYQEL